MKKKQGPSFTLVQRCCKIKFLRDKTTFARIFEIQHGNKLIQ